MIYMYMYSDIHVHAIQIIVLLYWLNDHVYYSMCCKPWIEVSVLDFLLFVLRQLDQFHVYILILLFSRFE